MAGLVGCGSWAGRGHEKATRLRHAGKVATLGYIFEPVLAFLSEILVLFYITGVVMFLIFYLLYFATRGSGGSKTFSFCGGPKKCATL